MAVIPYFKKSNEDFHDEDMLYNTGYHILGKLIFTRHLPALQLSKTEGAQY
jgi:hypothetical protein